METLLDKTIGAVRTQVRIVIDEYPDLDWLGTFSSEWEEHCLEWKGGRNTHKYFHPQPGMGKEYPQYAYDRMKGYNRGDWVMVGIVATVYIHGREIGNASLWGIEYAYQVEEYHLDVMRDVVWQVARDAREFLSLLGLEKI